MNHMQQIFTKAIIKHVKVAKGNALLLLWLQFFGS